MVNGTLECNPKTPFASAASQPKESTKYLLVTENPILLRFNNLIFQFYIHRRNCKRQRARVSFCIILFSHVLRLSARGARKFYFYLISVHVGMDFFCLSESIHEERNAHTKLEYELTEMYRTEIFSPVRDTKGLLGLLCRL